MAIQNFTLPEIACPAGVKTVSPSTVINNHPKHVFVTLTSSEWIAKVDQGSIARWGLEDSPNGAIWSEWLINHDIPYGSFGKDGTTIAAIAASGGTMAAKVGYLVRLFVEPTGVGMKCGATVTVTD